MNAPDIRDRQLEMVTGLCRELARVGLNVGMSDARPAVVLHSSVTATASMITVDSSGEFFEWREIGCRYPVTDPVSAAIRIAERIQMSESESEDAS